VAGWYYLLLADVGEAKHLPVDGDSEKENNPPGVSE